MSSLKYPKNLELWFALIILFASTIFSVIAFALWYQLTFFIGPYLFIHWLGIIGSVFIAVFNPLYYILRRRKRLSKTFMRLHVFGNLFAFLLVSLHFAQNFGRLVEIPQRLSEGLVLYFTVFIVIITGLIERFFNRKSSRLIKNIHKYIVILLLFILLIHTLEGFNLVPAGPSPSPSPSISPTNSPTPTTPSSSPSPSTSPPSPSPTPLPSQTPLPTPSASPTTLYPGEVRNYEGQDLSSIADFRENSIKGPQNVPTNTYRLTITGLVNLTKEYTYDEIVNGFQKYQKVVTIYCVEGWYAKILWEGFLLKDLFNETGINPQATVVIFKAYDGYSTALPLNFILDNNILIAYKMNDITLPPERGFPFQLVAENKYGYKWIKWITEIELSDDTGYLGYWERIGWPNDASLP